MSAVISSHYQQLCKELDECQKEIKKLKGEFRDEKNPEAEIKIKEFLFQDEAKEKIVRANMKVEAHAVAKHQLRQHEEAGRNSKPYISSLEADMNNMQLQTKLYNIDCFALFKHQSRPSFDFAKFGSDILGVKSFTAITGSTFKSTLISFNEMVTKMDFNTAATRMPVNVISGIPGTV